MKPASIWLPFCAAPLAIIEPASAAPQHVQHGPWQILSVGEAGSHRFDYCAAEAEFDGGLALTIERNGTGQTVLVVQTQTPSFVARAGYNVRIAVLPGFAAVLPGHTSDAKTLALPLDAHTGLMAALAQGRSLSLDLPSGTDLFALESVGPAIADLERCLANPTGRRAPSARGIVQAVLDRAASGPIQLAYPAGSTRDQDRDYAWNEGPVAGGAREVEVAPGTPFLDLVLARLDRLASRCGGRFAPELDAPVETTGGVIESGAGTCRDAGADRLVALLYVKAGDQFAEFVLEAPAEARGAAMADRDSIAKIVRTAILNR